MKKIKLFLLLCLFCSCANRTRFYPFNKDSSYYSISNPNGIDSISCFYSSYNTCYFYNGLDFMYITADHYLPIVNQENILDIVLNDSLKRLEFAVNHKIPSVIKGEKYSGYYFNYTDGIIHIGYNNVKCKSKKKYFDKMIKGLKRIK